VLRCHWSDWKYGASKLRFAQTSFSKNYLQLGHTPPEKLTNPVLGQKHVKIISVNGHQIICQFKAPTYLRQTLGISSDKLHAADNNYASGEESHSLTALLMYASTAGNVLLKELKL